MERPRRCKRYCCVVNCHNSERYSDPSVKFFAFPWKEYEKERRQKWILAVNRMNPDGSPWQPSKHTKICGQHFIGGKPSTIENHPSYNPTIFPPCYHKEARTEGDVLRYERFKKRKILNEEVPVQSPSVDACTDIYEEPKMKSVGVQVGTEYETSEFVFVVTIDGNNLATQCNIKNNDITRVQENNENCELKGPSVCKGFHGYKDIKREAHLTDLTSTSFQSFEMLLSFLTFRLSLLLANENVLLLFLIKMKTGITFGALGVLFGVHRTTCTRLFFKTLDILCQATQNFIFWPSRLSVQKCMPEPFKKNYPDTRIIIDCTEIKTEVPNRVDDRIYMYSNYKSAHTFKFLLAVTPDGTIAFKSKCYGGKASDTYITNNCGFLNLLDQNDVVLADKGFPGIKANTNSVIVMPPFLHNGRFSYEEIMETQSIASVRVHVERCIQRVKVYKILKFLPHSLFSRVDNIVHMACVLANLMPPIFKNVTNN